MKNRINLKYKDSKKNIKISIRNFGKCSPYNSGHFIEYYKKYGGNDVFKEKILGESHFKKLLHNCKDKIDLIIFNNFIADRFGVTNICRDRNIDTIHTEDGFFPHYETISADPLGFCWESSLPRIVFRECKEHHRNKSKVFRQNFFNFSINILPDFIKKPYFVFPLQLIGDKVNIYGHNIKDVSDWIKIIIHFRKCLPEDIQLVIKIHPRSGKKEDYKNELEEKLKDLKNCIILNKQTDLRTLLYNCSGAAGMNSTVLYEARLIYKKPVYVYSKSWFTNHEELFTPVYDSLEPRPLNNSVFFEDPIENSGMNTQRLNDYSDWFLYQLLIRQYNKKDIDSNPEDFLRWSDKLTFKSFIKYGEENFE